MLFRRRFNTGYNASMREERQNHERRTIAPLRLLSGITGWLFLAAGILLFIVMLWESVISTNPAPDQSMLVISAVGFSFAGLVLKLLGP